MFRGFRRFPLAALVIVPLAWLPNGVVRADAVQAGTEHRAENPSGAAVPRPVVAAMPEDARPMDASSLLAHELGQALFPGHRDRLDDDGDGGPPRAAAVIILERLGAGPL